MLDDIKSPFAKLVNMRSLQGKYLYVKTGLNSSGGRKYSGFSSAKEKQILYMNDNMTGSSA